ncbi:MAG: four helix bundle protein [Ruminococcaceae bacterium]|nr:four helix bundle protein [Oscillospiraceae bacterium]
MKDDFVENVSLDKSFDYAVRIVNLCKYLNNDKKEYIMSKQLLRCGTSIGANISEAQRGQSLADFTTKMCIALKEANESEYWLRLLYKTDYLEEKQFESIHKDAEELINILTSICKTSQEKMKI